MAFRPSYGMPHGVHYPHYPPAPQIMFGQMRLAGQNQPAPKQPTQQSTPVFVGNISEKCSDDFMKKMLEECGTVTSWKRIQGTNGKLQGFGFCNFADAEGTLRALRILNEFHLGDKKLTVKAEEKVRSELRKTAIENRRRQGKKDLKLKDNELPADEDDLKKDEEIRLKILHWIETDHPELLTLAEDGELSDKETKKDITKSSGKRDADRYKKDDRDRNRRRRSRSVSRRSVDRGRSSPKRKRSRRSQSSSSSSTDSRSSRSSSSGSSDSSRSRSPRRDKSSKRRRDRSLSRSSEDSEDAREKRFIRQQVKEKEANYLGRLKRWESREKQRSKIYEREERKEKDRKKETQKEAKRLKHFLEDYDDEKDDPKYYKSSSLFQRKRDFEKEREADQKDRLREQQEIEELKKQIMDENPSSGENFDFEEEARKRHKIKEEEALKKLRADSGSPNPHQPLGHSAIPGEESSSESGSDEEPDGDIEKPKKEEKSAQSTPCSNPTKPQNGGGWKALGSNEETSLVRPINKKEVAVNSPGVATSSQSAAHQQPIAQRLNGVFGNDDEEDELTRRKKLKPFEITREERMQVMSAEERKEISRNIIKNLPTEKDEVFASPIEWDYLDKNAMDSRIRPWVERKISEFFGDDDAHLVDFICDKLKERASPEVILNDLAIILDDDAISFVVKMWRLLMFEGQVRKQGAQ